MQYHVYVISSDSCLPSDWHLNFLTAPRDMCFNALVLTMQCQDHNLFVLTFSHSKIGNVYCSEV